MTHNAMHFTVTVPVPGLGTDPETGTALLQALERLVPTWGPAVVQNTATGAGHVTLVIDGAIGGHHAQEAALIIVTGALSSIGVDEAPTGTELEVDAPVHL